MDTKARLAQANNFLQLLPHCKKLGMKVMTASDGQLTLELPYQPEISGLDSEGYVHGGILTTMMDTVCGFAVTASLPAPEFCPTLDLRIDHMRRASTKGPIFAWAECYKITRSVCFTRGYAYQDDPTDPIVHCVATFMRSGKTWGKSGFVKIGSSESLL
jgi:uncharacterized protein (TIGR00369 family)